MTPTPQQQPAAADVGELIAEQAEHIGTATTEALAWAAAICRALAAKLEQQEKRP